MPVSTSVHLSHCLNHIIQLNPRSILDVGCGFGTWGYLCRCYLDAFNERPFKETWQVKINGIEYFERYILDHQRALYDDIQIGDIRDLAPDVEPHELIICGDVIEHLDKEEGQAVLDVLYEKATRALMLNIPLGEGWDHPEVHGNPAELHRSKWQPEDFLRFPGAAEQFQFQYAGAYGCFVFPKDVSPDLRCTGLVEQAGYMDKNGESAGAANYLRQALDILPGHRESAMLLADMMLREGDIEGGKAVLDTAYQHDPEFHFAGIMLARIEATQQHDEAALHRIEEMVGRGLPPEFAADAESMRDELRARLGQ